MSKVKKYLWILLVVYTFFLSVYYWLIGVNELSAAYMMAFAGWIQVEWE